MKNTNNTNNTIVIPAPIVVGLPAGTEATIEWGGIHLSGWEPSRDLTREDCWEVRRLLMEAGVGEVSAQSAARRWQYNFGEDYSPGGFRGPESGGRKPRQAASDEPLTTAVLGEEMSLVERRPALHD